MYAYPSRLDSTNGSIQISSRTTHLTPAGESGPEWAEETVNHVSPTPNTPPLRVRIPSTTNAPYPGFSQSRPRSMTLENGSQTNRGNSSVLNRSVSLSRPHTSSRHHPNMQPLSLDGRVRLVESLHEPATEQNENLGQPNRISWKKGRRIGKGPRGSVYRATRCNTGFVMAVKAYDNEDLNSDSAKTLVDAAYVMRNLEHENIVQCFGHDVSGSTFYILYDFFPGLSLTGTLRVKGELKRDVVRYFTRQILQALDYIHSHGIVSGNLTADNVLVSEQGVCKITDIGTRANVQPGNWTLWEGGIFRLAPELIHTLDQRLSPKVDIWSLGFIVVQMWAGSKPWVGTAMVPILFQLYHEKKNLPIPEGVTLSSEADDFRLKTLAVDLAQRPPASQLLKHSYLTLPTGWQFQ
ncbi:kinase-like domain-containing protein [Flagelloscypha sp. PMI_526]|nr:kinase-like domain-containing protein [Flagelloscypha sp. PMI_526]